MTAHEAAPIWAAGVARAASGALCVNGHDVRDLAEQFGTPVYVLDETDFRDRARAFRRAFADGDVYYAAKAFLCTAVARWVAEEGLGLDVASGGELAVALACGLPGRADRGARQQQVRCRAGTGARAWVSGGSSWTPSTRSIG